MEFDPRHMHKVPRAVTHQTQKVLGKFHGFSSKIFSNHSFFEENRDQIRFENLISKEEAFSQQYPDPVSG